MLAKITLSCKVFSIAAYSSGDIFPIMDSFNLNIKYDCDSDVSNQYE